MRSYNFYVFPRPSRIVPDTKFSCQSSSLEFISKHGLDFGKVIKEGITYLKVSREKSYHDRLLLKHKQQLNQKPQQHNKKITQQHSQQNNNNIYHWSKENTANPSNLPSHPPSIHIPSAHQDYIDKQTVRIEEYLQESSDAILTLDTCSPYTRKTLYSVLQTRYGERLFVRGGGGGDGGLQVVRLTGPEHRKEIQANMQQEDIDELNKLVGFTKIIKLLHQSGKLIIGHNMLVDLLHTIHQFWTDLPSDYIDFKQLLHLTFPNIVDTKYIASMPHFKDISSNINLELLEKDLKKSPKVPAIIFESAQDQPMADTASFHNASYDALITASCYVRMNAYLELHYQDVSIESLQNKLYMMRITDIPYMNVAGDDLPLSREHMFHVQFTADKKRHDIQTVFNPYGQVYMKFLNDTSAYVCLLDRHNASEVKDKVCRYRSDGMKVEPFMEYRKKMDGLKDGEVGVMKRKVDEKKEANSSIAIKKKKISEKNTNVNSNPNNNSSTRNNTDNNTNINNNTSRNKKNNNNKSTFSNNHARNTRRNYTSNNTKNNTDSNTDSNTNNNNKMDTSSKADTKRKNLITKTLEFLKIANTDTNNDLSGVKGATEIDIPEWE